MSRAVNAVLIGAAATVVIVAVFWLFASAGPGPDDGGGPLTATTTPATTTSPTGPTDPTETTESSPTSATEEPSPTTTTSHTTRTSAQTTTQTTTNTLTETQTETDAHTETVTVTPTEPTNATPSQDPNVTTQNLTAAGPPPSLVVLAVEAVPIDPRDVEQISISLILGGLLMLGVVVVLVMTRAIFPAGKQRPQQRPPAHHRLRPTPNVDEEPRVTGDAVHATGTPEGHRAGRGHGATNAHEVAVAFNEQGWGQARLLSVQAERVRLRVYDCKRHPEQAGCGDVVGFLEAAFRTNRERPRVIETACGADRSRVCDFEVRT